MTRPPRFVQKSTKAKTNQRKNKEKDYKNENLKKLEYTKMKIYTNRLGGGSVYGDKVGA